MKSFSAAVKLSALRLFRYALPNDVHGSVPPPPEVKASKSICASPKVRGLIGTPGGVGDSPSESAAGIAVVLI
jgi:hypothetical protein